MHPTRRTILATAPLLAAGSPRAIGQARFPAKPIRLVVPVAAGGGADMIARTVAERWAQELGQSIIVENRGGGGGVIACQMVAQAPADGYTLLEGYVATHGTSPATRTVPYDPIKDFSMIGMIGGAPNVLVVPANSPVKDVDAFVAFARQQPGGLNYGSAGAGSLTHLMMEVFAAHHALTMQHAAYRGVAPAFTDLIGGQTQAMFPAMPGAFPHIRAGRVRPLALTGRQRHPLLPDVPTLEEKGMPGFDALQWYGVVGPAGIPADVMAILNASLNKILADPSLSEKLSGEALTLLPMTPDQFRRFIADDIARWTKVAKDRGINLDS